MVRASPYVDMKLPELKQKVWKAWSFLNEWKGQVLQPENYTSEIKRFGDRRYKKTWVKALAYFKAVSAYENCLDAYMLILHTFNFTPDRWDYEYRHEILDAFLMYPDGMEIIKQGLEQLFSKDFSPQEREEADGFYSLVEEREEDVGTVRITARSPRRLPGAVAAA
ncbi:hypothetical protein IQ260_27305 [Leptolyngbya cf. ectocarpi LEGE 11479]|uniref:Uncharacterized protein n=1 Tax=Leptolyngbya cf. ectocarpi LEGE 11479 TaxID=1828722 RepID=A0A929FB12_LEPEC|nr:hypothetical protein [Leptolyngbya ectocarpi]MBE9070356.1 hypothetical protein [Leptolyngbya cf. ectocarpi LEGE 11479]